MFVSLVPLIFLVLRKSKVLIRRNTFMAIDEHHLSTNLFCNSAIAPALDKDFACQSYVGDEILEPFFILFIK